MGRPRRRPGRTPAAPLALRDRVLPRRPSAGAEDRVIRTAPNVRKQTCSAESISRVSRRRARAANRAGSRRPAGDLRPASAAAAGRTNADLIHRALRQPGAPPQTPESRAPVSRAHVDPGEAEQTSPAVSRSFSRGVLHLDTAGLSRSRGDESTAYGAEAARPQLGQHHLGHLFAPPLPASGRPRASVPRRWSRETDVTSL